MEHLHTLQITMLGPRGVGKTTLLTAMYEQFESNIGRTNLQLNPNDESAALLQEKLGQLKRLISDSKGIEAHGGMSANVVPANLTELPIFHFGLGKVASPASLVLHFHDYPGGFIEGRATPEQRAHVKSLLERSHVVVIAINAPALMEDKGKWHDTFNRPLQIKSMFATAYENLDSPRLVLFVPVRCEKYVADEKGAQKLTQRVQEGYSHTFGLFGSANLRSKVAAVITPVQTVGSVVFSRIQMRGDEPEFLFRKTTIDAQYCPRDSEQPLRYLLSFLLKLHYQHQQKRWGIWSFLRGLFGMDDHLLKSAQDFAEDCKRSGGFQVVQGNDLLTIPRR